MPDNTDHPAGANGHVPSPLEAQANGLAEDLLDVALAEQRRDWTAGKRTPAAEWLRGYPALASDPALAAELVYHQFTLREELGEAPDWADFLRQFSQHADLLRLLRQADQVVEQALAPATPAPPPAALLRDYELLEEVGRGGMGVVFKARQRNLDRIVALKMIRAGECPGEEERQRFDREARVVARLQHPHIVQVHEAGQADGQPFLALEFVEGQSLARRLGGTPLPSRQAASLIAVLAGAMHYAHGQGIVHRDLKPSNVLLAGAPETPPERCVPKVTDFGLAKRLDVGGDTRSGAIVGTPSYMAPEQALGETAAIGPWTDVYGLGALLYELLTGRPPFRAEAALQTLRQVVEAEPARPRLLNPAVPRDLETVCLKCLEKEPHRRYPSAAALADDLGRWLRSEPVQARPLGSLGRAWRWCRRNPVPAVLTAAVVLALLGGLASTRYQLRQAEAARHGAETAQREAEASDVQAQELLSEVLQPSHDAPLQTSYSRRLPDIDALRKAEAHFERLLRNKPGDTRVRIALTTVRGSLGTLYGARGQTAEMEACFQDARGLWEALARQDPRNPEYRDWLATTYGWQARATRGQGEIGPSLQLSQRAYALWQELAEEQTGNMAVLQKLADRRWELLGPWYPEREEEFLRPLEEERALLGKLVGEHPAGTALRKRLVLTCLVLGEFHLGRRAPRAALPCWREAYEHSRKLAEAQPDDPMVELNLALCCCQLMGGQPADPYYTEAVALFGQAGNRLAALGRKHPDSTWLRYALLETYCFLAVCHWQAGRAAQAEHAFQHRVRPLVAQVREHPIDLRQGVHCLDILRRAASSVQEAKHPAAVLAVVREAATLTERYADAPWGDQALCAELADRSYTISAFLCRLGDAGEALRQAEQARRLYVGLRRAAPGVPRYGHGVSEAWERVAKARWELGRRDEALDAFRESAAVQRQVVAQAPSVRAYRVQLGRCYDRLAHWCGLAGDRAGVAAALLDREKLWPDDAEELMEVSRDFRELANAVGQGRAQLSPEEDAERRRYLSESERARRAAEQVRHAAPKGAPPG